MAVISASKSELLEWINSYFQVRYTKIEQCGTGVVYCLIFNALYPDIINIQRVNSKPTTDFHILNNYKLLQHGFNKVKISRDVNVERLMKCRLQDNLEFLQWFGRLWCEHHKDFSFSSTTSISASGSRRASVANTPKSKPASATPITRPTRTVSASARPTSASTSTARTTSSSSRVSSSSTVKSTPANLHNGITSARKTSASSTSTSTSTPVSASTSAELNNLKNEVKQLSLQLEDMTTFKDGLEIERNFYFNKLRDIEILCQDIQTSGNAASVSTITLVNDIMEIMYQTEDGFLLPEQAEAEVEDRAELETETETEAEEEAEANLDLVIDVNPTEGSERSFNDQESYEKGNVNERENSFGTTGHADLTPDRYQSSFERQNNTNIIDNGVNISILDTVSVADTNDLFDDETF